MWQCCCCSWAVSASPRNVPLHHLSLAFQPTSWRSLQPTWTRRRPSRAVFRATASSAVQYRSLLRTYVTMRCSIELFTRPDNCGKTVYCRCTRCSNRNHQCVPPALYSPRECILFVLPN
uniref:Uncharacterized protein n=1 Tax=Rhipicephalus microplus TaxID=6941 RepID=A0A6G5A0E8_RHIMP